MSQSPPDPWEPQPSAPQGWTPPAGQEPWQPQPGQPQPGQPQPGPGGLPQWPGQPGVGQPDMGQPGAPQPYGWMAQTRFDPADPLISDDYNGWWRRSIAIMRRGWRPLALTQLLVVVPMLALQIPAQIYSDQQERSAGSALAEGTGTPDFGALLAPLGVVFGAAIIAGMIYALGMLATMRLAVVVATGGQPSIGAALGVAVRRVPAMIGWYILAGLLSLVALIACFLPIIYVAAVLTVLPAVVLFERTGAISRCFRLFHADLGASVSRVATLFGMAIASSVVLGVLTLVAGLALQGSAAFDTTLDVSTGSIVALSVVTSLLNGVYYVLVAVVAVPLIVTAYADMRARHEPFTGASLAAEPRAEVAG